jgi:tetratricopeptide (TPR) repeat protein
MSISRGDDTRKQRGGRRRNRTNAAPELNPRQRLLLIFFVVIAPFLLLALVELGLRIGGYGSSYPLFVPYGRVAPGYLVPNQAVGGLYFPGSPRPPRPAADPFLARKPADGLRFVVQGASSAAGWPYSFGGAFSRMLQQRLARSYPNRSIEVINTALTGTNTYTLVDQAHDIIKQHPDAVLIYAGHNEYYGVFGVGSSVSVGRRLVRLYLVLARFRTFQLMRNIWERIRGTGARMEAPRNLMERLAAKESIPFDSNLHQAGIRQFRSNLGRLLEAYRQAGIPVYIATIASNERDLSPFVGAPEGDSANAAFSSELGQVGSALESGDTAAAQGLLRSAVQRFPDAADPWYALAKTFDWQGRYDSAAVRYRGAKDRDRLPFRAPSAMNQIIREQAARTSATVVDAQAELRAASPHGIVGKTLILEHVHPDIEGQFLIADAFYNAIRHGGLVADTGIYVPLADARRHVPVTAVDSMVGEFYVQRLTAGFPFQPKGVTRTAAVDTMRPRTPVQAIALDYFHGRISWLDAQHRLRGYYGSSHQPFQAVHVDEVVAQELPFDPAPLLDAAGLARLAGDLDRTADLAARAGRRKESAASLALSAGVLATRGDDAGARRQLERARQLAPGDRRVRLALDALRAIPDLEARAADPAATAEILTNLGVVYFLTTQYDRAQTIATRVLRLHPGYAPAVALQHRLDALLTG